MSDMTEYTDRYLEGIEQDHPGIKAVRINLAALHTENAQLQAQLADAMAVIKLYETWYVPIEPLRDKPPVAVYKATQAAKEK